MEATTTERREYESVTTPTGDVHTVETVTVEQAADVPEVAPVVVEQADDFEASMIARMDAMSARLDGVMATIVDLVSSERPSVRPTAEAAPIAAEPAESETVVETTPDVVPPKEDATTDDAPKSEARPRKKAAGVIF